MKNLSIFIILLLAFVADAVTGFSSVVSTSTASIACTLTQACTGPIVFDQVIVANDTTHNVIGVSTLTSIAFSAIQNETLIVNAICYAGCNVTGVGGVTDTQNNVFHFIAEQRSNPANDTIDAFWTMPLLGTDQVTVNWSSANYNFFELALYKNTRGVGAPVGKIDQVSLFTTSITITQSGSWAIGLGGTGSAITDSNCQALFPRAGSSIKTVRVNSCSFIPTVGPSSGFISDNATALQNGLSVSFGVDAVGQTCGPYVCLGIEFEILPGDLEPNIVPPAQYFINYAGVNTKPNALNQVLAPNTAYCTGLTTLGLIVTDTGTRTLEVLASYGGVSLNTTGMKLNVAIQVSTTAPQTTFGTGCSIAAQTGTEATIVFTTSGALGAANSYVAALTFAVVESVPSTTTFYAFVVISTQGFTGHANYDQVLNQAYSFGTISIKEIH